MKSFVEPLPLPTIAIDPLAKGVKNWLKYKASFIHFVECDIRDMSGLCCIYSLVCSALLEAYNVANTVVFANHHVYLTYSKKGVKHILDGKYYFLSKATGMLYQEEFINTYVRHGMEDNLTDLAVIVNIVRAKHAGNVRATLKGPLNIKSMTDAMPENLDLTPDTLRSWMALCTTLVVPIHHRHCQTFWEQNPSYIRVVEQFQDLKLVKVKKGFQVKCTRGTERYTGQKGVVLPFEEAGLIFLKVLYSFKLYWTNAETALEREGELISVRSISSAKSEIAVPSDTY